MNQFKEMTLFKEVNYSLSELVEDITLGEIGIPDVNHLYLTIPNEYGKHIKNCERHSKIHTQKWGGVVSKE